jgi:hypothetical protein
MVAGCLMVFLLGLFRGLRRNETAGDFVQSSAKEQRGAGQGGVEGSGPPVRPRRASAAPAPTADEIVAGKVREFGRSRRELVRAIARRSQKDIPPEIERFFDAVEAGDWNEIDAQWTAMSKRSGQYEGSTHSPELDPYWMAVLDAYGVAEQGHLWPAQQLLDYGHAVLDSLRPGMVYVGGTDPGRWIPELLNETSGGEPHVMVTQNAMADGRYLEFMHTLYGDRLATLTSEDSQLAFQEYITDAQKRLEHDQQFPDEPKQMRPGEDARVVDGRFQVSGQVAVMAINEKLLQALMNKNPDLSFAIGESSPLRGTYADALPLGPLMELRAQDGQNKFTADRAAQSLEYWQATAQQVLSDPVTANTPDALKTYSHDANSSANLLAAHHYTDEAEQAYRLASQLWPGNPEPVGGLAGMLARGGRAGEARQILEDFTRNFPDQRDSAEKIKASLSFPAPAPAQPARR